MLLLSAGLLEYIQFAGTNLCTLLQIGKKFLPTAELGNFQVSLEIMPDLVCNY